MLCMIAIVHGILSVKDSSCMGKRSQLIRLKSWSCGDSRCIMSITDRISAYNTVLPHVFATTRHLHIDACHLSCHLENGRLPKALEWRGETLLLTPLWSAANWLSCKPWW